MRFLFLAALAAALLPAQEANHGKGHSHHGRTAAQWEKVLENPERDAWQKPHEVIAALGLRGGEAVADIGAGSGYFSAPLAKAVGPEGALYAVDVQQDLIDLLGARAEREGLKNLRPTLGAFDDPNLAAESVDLIFICDVVHHIENRQAYYAKLAQALRPGGRLAIVDFYKRELPVGPDVAMKIAKADMVEELRQAGFTLAEEHDFLPHQYYLIFRADAQ